MNKRLARRTDFKQPVIKLTRAQLEAIEEVHLFVPLAEPGQRIRRFNPFKDEWHVGVGTTHPRPNDREWYLVEIRSCGCLNGIDENGDTLCGSEDVVATFDLGRPDEHDVCEACAEFYHPWRLTYLDLE